MLRSKKGLDARQRLDELFNCQVGPLLPFPVPSSHSHFLSPSHAQLFKRLNESDGAKVRQKVCAVAGDIALPELGISEQDMQTMIQEVSVVFHSAATVKFDEPLKTSVEFNVLGTRRVIQLCHRMPLLKVEDNYFERVCLSACFPLCRL